MEKNFWYLFWAYNVIWFLICGYLLTLGVRQRRIEKQIDRLKGTLGATLGGTPGMDDRA